MECYWVFKGCLTSSLRESLEYMIIVIILFCTQKKIDNCLNILNIGSDVWINKRNYKIRSCLCEEDHRLLKYLWGEWEDGLCSWSVRGMQSLHKWIGNDSALPPQSQSLSTANWKRGEYSPCSLHVPVCRVGEALVTYFCWAVFQARLWYEHLWRKEIVFPPNQEFVYCPAR